MHIYSNCFKNALKGKQPPFLYLPPKVKSSLRVLHSSVPESTTRTQVVKLQKLIFDLAVFLRLCKGLIRKAQKGRRCRVCIQNTAQKARAKSADSQRSKPKEGLASGLSRFFICFFFLTQGKKKNKNKNKGLCL